MRLLPRDEKLLSLLNDAQPAQPWRCTSERRRCVACESVFRGDEVAVRWSRHGVRRLTCPGCGSGPTLWVRLGNPLVDETAWADWETALAFASAEPADDEGELAAAF